MVIDWNGKSSGFGKPFAIKIVPAGAVELSFATEEINIK
jgi:hypothetical protein